MSDELRGKTIAFAVANEGIEQVELTEPWQAIEQAGGTPKLSRSSPARCRRHNHLEKADTFEVDATFADADARDYDALVLPGGVANPDRLRMDDKAVGFIRAFFDAGKPVAAICHAPWTLVEADVVRGPHADVVAQPADRPAQCRRVLGGRGGRRRRFPHYVTQAGRPAGVQCDSGQDVRHQLTGLRPKAGCPSGQPAFVCCANRSGER